MVYTIFRGHLFRRSLSLTEMPPTVVGYLLHVMQQTVKSGFIPPHPRKKKKKTATLRQK